jgi:hypothetical protein
MSNSVVEVFFTSVDDSEVSSLEFTLFDHTVAMRWRKLVEISQNLGPSFRALQYGKGIFNLDEIALKIKDLLQSLSGDFTSVWKDGYLTGFKPSTSYLNGAHVFFENAINYVKSVPPVLPEEKAKLESRVKDLYLLNDLIHQTESLLDNSNGVFLECLLDNGMMGELTKEETSLFEIDQKWGYLYLSFCHLGVSYLTSYFTKYPLRPVPQTRISGNFIINFKEQKPFQEHEALKSWLLNTKGVPLNWEDLTLGMIPLGMIKGDWSEEKISIFLKKFPKLGKKIKFHGKI